MNKYDNFIYLTITELATVLFKSTNFVSYSEYCKGMYNSLITSNLSKRDHRHIIQISDELEKIYSMGITLTGIYIYNYFALDKEIHHQFEKSVLITRKTFPIIGY